MTLFVLLILSFAFGEKYLPDVDVSSFMYILDMVKTCTTLFVVFTTIVAFLGVFSSLICIYCGWNKDKKKCEEIRSVFLSKEIIGSDIHFTDTANQHILATFLSEAQLNVSGGESSIKTEIPDPEKILSTLNSNDEQPPSESLHVSSQYNSGEDDGIEIGDEKPLTTSPDDELPVRSPVLQGKPDYDDASPSEPELQNYISLDENRGDKLGNDSISIKTPPHSSVNGQD